jgi:TPR repeat protein
VAQGVAQDNARAAALFKQSCDAGNAVACDDLGAAYQGGAGVPQDGARAVALFQHSCELGNAAACKPVHALRRPRRHRGRGRATNAIARTMAAAHHHGASPIRS